MRSLLPDDPPFKAGPTKVQADPPEVLAFRRLVEARRRHDYISGRRLAVELRSLGWQVVPVEPKRAGCGRA